jgi:hypothetical protein
MESARLTRCRLWTEDRRLLATLELASFACRSPSASAIW